MRVYLLLLLFFSSVSWEFNNELSGDSFRCIYYLIQVKDMLQARVPLREERSLEEGHVLVPTREELTETIRSLSEETITRMADLLEDFCLYLDKESQNVARYEALLQQVPRQIRSDTMLTMMEFAVGMILISAGYNPWDFIRAEFYEHVYSGDMRMLNHIPANLVYFAPVLLPVWHSTKVILKLASVGWYMPKACEFNYIQHSEQLEDALATLKNLPLYGELLEKLIKFVTNESDEIFDNDKTHEQATQSSKMSWIDWLKLSFWPS